MNFSTDTIIIFFTEVGRWFGITTLIDARDTGYLLSQEQRMVVMVILFVGIAWSFAGQLMYRFWISLTAMIVGFSVGAIIGLLFTSNNTTAIIFGVIGGVVFAVLAVRFLKLGIFFLIACFVFGLIVGVLNLDSVSFYVTTLIIATIVGLASFKFPAPIVIIVTSILGAFLVSEMLGILADVSQTTREMTLIILALLGIGVQFVFENVRRKREDLRRLKKVGRVDDTIENARSLLDDIEEAPRKSDTNVKDRTTRKSRDIDTRRTISPMSRSARFSGAAQDTSGNLDKAKPKTRSKVVGKSVRSDRAKVKDLDKSKATELDKIKVASGDKAEVAALVKPKVEAPAKPKVEATAKPKVEATAKLKVEAPAKVKVEAPAKAQVETPAKAQVETPAKAQVETPAKAQVETPAKAQVAASAKPKVAAPAKPKVAAPAKLKFEAPVKAKVASPGKTKVAKPATPKVAIGSKIKGVTSAKTRVASPAKTKMVSLSKPKIASPVRTRTTSPVKTKATGIANIKEANPVKTKAINPAKAKLSNPVKSKNIGKKSVSSKPTNPSNIKGYTKVANPKSNSGDSNNI